MKSLGGVSINGGSFEGSISLALHGIHSGGWRSKSTCYEHMAVSCGRFCSIALQCNIMHERIEARRTNRVLVAAFT